MTGSSSSRSPVTLIDGPASERLDRLAALGFFACGPVYYGDAKQLDQYDDRIDTLTRGFLGLTVACARCHDHKYDPIPTTRLLCPGGRVRQHGATSKCPPCRRSRSRPMTRPRPRSRPGRRRSPAFLQAEARRLNKKVTNDQLKAVRADAGGRRQEDGQGDAGRAGRPEEEGPAQVSGDPRPGRRLPGRPTCPC